MVEDELDFGRANIAKFGSRDKDAAMVSVGGRVGGRVINRVRVRLRLNALVLQLDALGLGCGVYSPSSL